METKTAEAILKERIAESESFYRFYKSDVLQAMHEYAEQVKPKWVSVEDGLPNANIDVLVCVSLNGFSQVKADKFRVSDSYGNEKNWFNYFNVTHWMPLPLPPQP